MPDRKDDPLEDQITAATARRSSTPPANEAAGQTIEAVRFQPTQATASQRTPLLTPWRVVLLLAAALAAWFLWFIFSAKSVRIEVHPSADTFAIEGGFAFQLGEVHLLRQGSYRVRASASGYQPIDRGIRIGAERNQTVVLEMTKLPGRVTFDVTPEGALVEVAGSGEQRGEAPFEATIAAGPQAAFVSHPRYQGATVEFDVEGLDRPQTVAVALAPNWAEVTIPTRPPGADVLIDGESAGVATPAPAEVLAGEHRISVKLAGHKTWTDILHIEAGRDVVLPAVTLEKADGIVMIDSTPHGASITVDGAYRGVTPLEVALHPARRHRIRALKVGHAPQQRTLEVGSGKERRISFTLEALRGDLAIQTQPEDAQLWIDGEHQGGAAGTVRLAAVPHEIEIKKEGYASYRKTVTPQPGFVQELKVRLLTLAEARMEALRRVRTTSEGQELVLLSPSPIRMGASRREPGRRANEKLHTANLTRLFYLSRHEVTNGQFRAFAAGHSSGAFQEIDLNEDQQPVVRVSWTEAALYCNWLSRKDGLRPFYREEYGKISGFDADALGYRLPTEAEWAWSARHVAESEPLLRFAWGERLPPPDRHGNYADRSATHLVARIVFDYNDNHVVSAPVGTFPANAKGIHDLGGNVAEWVHDYYGIPSGAETLNPLGPKEGEYHVIRGASWQKGTVTDLRLSFRDYGTEGRHDVGFRIARFAE